MKETNTLINISSFFSIISGLVLAWNMLEKGDMNLSINFVFYIIGMFTWIMGVLCLFREARSKK